MGRSVQSIMNRALERFGGRYLPASVVLVQLIAFIAGPGLLITQNNAAFSPLQFTTGAWIAVVMALATVAAMGVWALYANRDAYARLNEWSRGERVSSAAAQDGLAWLQVNSLTLRFLRVSFLTSYIGQTAPLLVYLYWRHQISGSQMIYTLLGMLAATIAGTAMAVLLLDGLLHPARSVLIPSGFETQLEGVAQFRVSTKLLGISAALILISILLIGPIGYRHTFLAATAIDTAPQALLSFQYQSLLATLIVLVLGLFLSYLIVRSLTDPIQRMVEAFQLIEKGDLGQRISVTAADELGELAVYFNHMIERLGVLQESLEAQVKERTAQLRATIQVANAVSGILDVEKLVEQVVELISNEFGYYYVALFLNDPSGKWAELQAATGEAGRLLRANRHRLEIGGKSMVGMAIASREATVAMDTGEGQIRFDNPLLPYTRSEIALPLTVGARVVGALDAQSTRAADFDPQDIDTLKAMANQVAIAIENARLFQDAQQSLQDMRAIQRQYLLSSWKGFAAEKGAMDYEIGDLDPREAVSEIQIPLSLREQLLGEIELSAERAWTPEERNMIEAIAAQAALALENARLVEESQTAARRERLLAEITGKIWASATVEGILQTAVREIGRALEGDEVTIELKVD